MYLEESFREARALGLQLDNDAQQDIYATVIQQVAAARGNIRFAILDVVADKALYSLPSVDIDGKSLDGARLRQVYWGPSDVVARIEGLVSFTEGGSVALGAWQELELRQALERYTYKYLDANHILLVPCPTSNGQVVLEYLMPKSADEFTPDDWELVRMGCTAYALARAHAVAASTMGWDAGTLSVQYTATQINELGEQARLYMDEYRQRLGVY